jgi:alpha-tubulin suppressor-like RCC1 family protein
MRWKSRCALTLLVFVGGCELYLGVGEGKLRECHVVDDCVVDVPVCSSNCKHEDVTSIVAGAFHTCALFTGGAVKCWGRNDFGQLGIGDRNNRGDKPDGMGGHLPQVSLGKDRYAVELAAGAFHTCALLDDGSMKCWGLNGIGQLGLGDTKSRGDDPNEMGDDLPTVDIGTGMTVIAIATGAYHTCALLSDKMSGMSMKCWGANASGQLGIGDTIARGNLPNTMGNALPAVDLGNGFTVSSVAIGDYFTCALSANGEVKCWGENSLGQLGQGDTFDRGDNVNEMGDALPSIQLGSGVSAVSLSLGNSHACAPLNGGVKCWGGNSKGQLGLGDVTPRGNAIGQMGEALPFVDPGMGTISQIVAGHSHTCAQFAEGIVKCWGWNQYGQLGIGDPDNRGNEPGEMGSALHAVELGRPTTMVAAGDTHTCALLDDGSVKCWGGNAFGQLGIGDTKHRGDEPGEMGAMLPEVNVFSGNASGMP